jgi:hypothetical protein
MLITRSKDGYKRTFNNRDSEFDWRPGIHAFYDKNPEGVMIIGINENAPDAEKIELDESRKIHTILVRKGNSPEDKWEHIGAYDGIFCSLLFYNFIRGRDPDSRASK